MSKSLFASKSFWFNALTAAAAILTAISGHAEIIPPAVMPYVVAILAAVNIALRMVTTEPVVIMK